MYLTYTDYQNMGGTLDETTFNKLEFETETIIDYYTFNRLRKETQYPAILKHCVYALLDLVQVKYDMVNPKSITGENVSGAIASQSNDGVSISYSVLSAKETIEQTDKAISQTINRYLANVVNSLGHKLLYRGVYPDE